MEQLTLKELLILIFSSAGFITGLVSVLTFAGNRLTEARNLRNDEMEKQISSSADMKKLELDSISFTKETFVNIINILKDQVNELRRDIEKCEGHRATDQEITSELRREIEKLKKAII